MTTTKEVEGYGRLGLENRAWVNEIPDDIIADAIVQDIYKKTWKFYRDIHDLTCVVKDIKKTGEGKYSITGDSYLAKKAIKFKVKVEVEAELVDDKWVKKEDLSKLNRELLER